MKEGKFKEFIKKAGKVVPTVLQAGGQLVSGNVMGAISTVKDSLINAAKESEEAEQLLNEFKMRENEFALEAYKLEIQDRQGARVMYSSDNWIQKALAIVFVVGYSFLSWYLLRVLMGASEMPKLAETMITMIWTATSAKLNTIIDFFFGGSMK